MDFMGFHIVDIVIVSLAAFLAIKGLVNGFTKELLSFITIVGGITLAAKFNTTVVELINKEEIVPTISDSYSKIIGFVIILVAVWLIIGVISSIIEKFTSNETGIFSRLFGYIISFARYIFIFSLIIFGVNQSDFFKDDASKLKKETKLFSPMSKIGASLLNIDINKTVTSVKSENNTTDTVDEDSITIEETSILENIENNISTISAKLTEHNSSEDNSSND